MDPLHNLVSSLQAEIQWDLGAIYARRGKVAKAFKHLAKSIEIELDRGQVFFQKGSYEKALQHSQKAIRLLSEIRKTVTQAQPRAKFPGQPDAFQLGIESGLKLWEDTRSQHYLREILQIIELAKSSELDIRLHLSEEPLRVIVGIDEETLLRLESWFKFRQINETFRALEEQRRYWLRNKVQLDSQKEIYERVLARLHSIEADGLFSSDLVPVTIDVFLLSLASLGIESGSKLWEDTCDKYHVAEVLTEIPRFADKREDILWVESFSKYKQVTEIIMLLEGQKREKLGSSGSSIEEIEMEVYQLDHILSRLYGIGARLRDGLVISKPGSLNLTPPTVSILPLFLGSFHNYNDECAILETYLLENKILYLLYDRAQLRFFEQELMRDHINAALHDLERALRQYKEKKGLRDPEIKRYLGQFYKGLNDVASLLLPTDLRQQLANLGAQDLFIIPHGPLHRLPWEGIEIGGKPLGIRYRVTRHFSLNLATHSLSRALRLDQMRGRSLIGVLSSGQASILLGGRDEKHALVVYNPSEPDSLDYDPIAVDEGQIVCNLLQDYEIRTLSANDATVKRILEGLSGASVVHFACHARFDDLDPRSSRIMLYDQSLTGAEVSSEKFENFPFVFLNACETGMVSLDTGAISWTEGYGQYGLVGAFMLANVCSMVVTGWDVGTKIACEFANQFYTEALSGEIVGEALQKARRTIWQNFKEESPDWAAYTLYGNPFRRIDGE